MSRRRSPQGRKEPAVVIDVLRRGTAHADENVVDREMEFAMTYLHEANLNASKAYTLVFGVASAAKASALLARPRVRRVIEAHMEAHSASLAEVLAFNTAVMRDDLEGIHCEVNDRLSASRTIAQIYAKIADIQRDKATDNPRDELDLSALSIEEMQTYCDLLSKITGSNSDAPLQALPSPLLPRQGQVDGDAGAAPECRPSPLQPVRQPPPAVSVEP